MSAAELIFIPFTMVSHVQAYVELAKLLTHRDKRLAITILILKRPLDLKDTISHIKKSSAQNPRITIVDLPLSTDSPPPPPITKKSLVSSLINSIDTQKPSVANFLAEAAHKKSGERNLAGLVLDMFCAGMIDVADDHHLPAYVFFPCSSTMLGLALNLHRRQGFFSHDHRKINLIREFEEGSELELAVPGLAHAVPARVWPSAFFEPEQGLLQSVARFRRTKGILLNTFFELEPNIIASLFSGEANAPKVYPVGPIIQFDREESREIVAWLDGQPESSVVFLCFGANAALSSEQANEVAVALENGGFRFLWSLRKPPPKDEYRLPTEYGNGFDGTLPLGFLERTRGRGRVIGWAPQMTVLSHRAVGGFVTHCGWNSALESIWCGVPMAAWPFAAEQQLNAFQIVRELGIGVEVEMDYRKESNVVVGSGKIEEAIRELMGDREIRVRAKELKEKGRRAVVDGGSSYEFLGRWIDDVMENVMH